MAIRVKTTPKEAYLLVEAEGLIESVQEVIDYVEGFLKVARQHNLRRFLVDEQAVMFHLDSYDLIELADYWDSQNLQQFGYRVATLPHPDTLDLHSDYETTASNRSLTYRHFPSAEAALPWVLEED